MKNLKFDSLEDIFPLLTVNGPFSGDMDVHFHWEERWNPSPLPAKSAESATQAPIARSLASTSSMTWAAYWMHHTHTHLYELKYIYIFTFTNTISYIDRPGNHLWKIFEHFDWGKRTVFHCNLICALNVCMPIWDYWHTILISTNCWVLRVLWAQPERMPF